MNADRYLKNCKLIFLLFMAAYLLVAGIGCTTKISQKGVLNQWRDESLPSFEEGRTTQSEILRFLGPPSQVIALSDQVIFYYMLERSRLRSYFLGIYNRSDEKVKYDRAIFFFDENEILTEYSYSAEEVPYEKPR